MSLSGRKVFFFLMFSTVPQESNALHVEPLSNQLKNEPLNGTDVE